MIKALVIGHLGKDATVNNVNGKNVINFNVAHTEKWKDAQGVEKQKTIWAECAYWSDKTGIVPYLKKGTQVYVEGQPDVNAYTTKDGGHGASLTIRVGLVQLLGGGENNGGGQAQTYHQQTGQPSLGNASFAQNSGNATSSKFGGDTSDDLPF